MDYEERRKELIELSSIDESEGYDIDECSINLATNGKIIFLSASGCSCWDGEYDEKEYDSIDDLEKDLIKGDEDGNDVYRYNPTLKGAKSMIAEARTKLASL